MSLLSDFQSKLAKTDDDEETSTVIQLNDPEDEEDKEDEDVGDMSW